jgi:hypothetical protein
LGEQKLQRLDRIRADVLVVDGVELVELQHVQQVMGLSDKDSPRDMGQQPAQPPHDLAQISHVREYVRHGDHGRGAVIEQDVLGQLLGKRTPAA